MIVDEDQQVLVSRMVCAREWARDVGVNDATCVRWLVLRVIVCVSGRVGLSTRRATVEAAVSKGRRGVCGDRW
eukprot:6212638-Pleurochrysis_carterae.AAC.3